MNLFKQVGLTGVIVVCATVAMARYYPTSHAVLGRLGVSDNVLAMVAEPQNVSADVTERDGGGPPGGGGARATIVTTAPVATGVVSAKLQAVGTSEALRSVSVVPLDTGVLTEVTVSSGDVVAAGDVLARLDSESEEITRDRAIVALRTAENTYTRYESLSQSNAATLTELDTLLSERDDAVLALREAEVALAQRTVLAPIGGSVGIVPVEVGDYVSTDTEIALIDDRQQVVVDFWVPERFAGMVALGQPVTATSLALSGTPFSGTISAIGSRVETDSRTLQVRAIIENTGDVLRPGMSFSIAMAFEGDTYPSVDPLAVQWDAEGSYVWVVADDMATRTPVRIVQRNADTVLIDAEIATGTQTITEGMLNVREGAPVVVQGASGPSDDVAGVDEDRPDLVVQTPTATGG
ncbi:RND family efflux transporter MFP subunit [Yoonia maricola]|uniref:RND family efflux transporter MFP subunit n=1 Tax=Yoonia maricola TaxID=420999 RepID=A0A2M8W490_9RHOB|nr:efflux RND transporter periplasmic adaptor subunit [Yoonia maricola]PJI85742.1 RND family efflux transporter MFP subunit [Yoonia maricola]